LELVAGLDVARFGIDESLLEGDGFAELSEGFGTVTELHPTAAMLQPARLPTENAVPAAYDQ
jgi:hypothetical protein